MLRLPASTGRRPEPAAPNQERAVEHQVEILLVALLDAAGGRQVVGLLVSQVHSIVRLDGHANHVRRSSASGDWEIVYEDSWIPVYHLSQSLGLAHGELDLRRVPEGPVRLLGLRVATDPPANQPGYIGFVVDEVVEIASYPVGQLRPFPRWVVTELPPRAIWGAVPAREGQTVLLLDGIALASQYLQS